MKPPFLVDFQLPRLMKPEGTSMTFVRLSWLGYGIAIEGMASPERERDPCWAPLASRKLGALQALRAVQFGLRELLVQSCRVSGRLLS